MNEALPITIGFQVRLWEEPEMATSQQKIRMAKFH